MKETIEVVFAKKVHEYERSSLFEDEKGEKFLLPKSQIEIVHEGRGCITVEMPEWLAVEKGLV